MKITNLFAKRRQKTGDCECKPLHFDPISMSRFLSVSGYEASRYRLVASFLEAKKGRVLDVGCHAGGLRKYISTDLRYFGIDREPNGFPGYVSVDLNAAHIPFRDKIFDAVNCTAVLEHLSDPLRMLREIKRVLKDDGLLLVSLPNDRGLNAFFSFFCERMLTYDEARYGHHWRFSIETARDFFEKEFMIIREVPEYGPLFRKYLFFLRIKPFCSEWFMLGIKNEQR